MSQDLTGVNHFHRRHVISISFSFCCRCEVPPTQMPPTSRYRCPCLMCYPFGSGDWINKACFRPVSFLSDWHPPLYQRWGPCSRWISHSRIPPSAEEHHCGSSESSWCYKSPRSRWNGPSWVPSKASGIRSVISFSLKTHSGKLVSKSRNLMSFPWSWSLLWQSIKGKN